MTWARLDDGITDRPDLLALDRSTRLVHLEAIVWSCRHETDGSIPAHVLRKVTDADDPTDAADALVAAGLWSETDGGWEVVGFLEDQISSGDLARQRELATVRQRRQRQHKAGDHSLCDARYCRRAAELSRVTDTVSHDTPTRPDPTRPVGEGKGGEGGQGGSADATPPARPKGPAVNKRTSGRTGGQPRPSVERPGAGTGPRSAPTEVFLELMQIALVERDLPAAEIADRWPNLTDGQVDALDQAASIAYAAACHIEAADDPDEIGRLCATTWNQIAEVTNLAMTRDHVEWALEQYGRPPDVIAAAATSYDRHRHGGAA